MGEGSGGGVDFACLFEVRDEEKEDGDDDGDADPTDTTLLLLLPVARIVDVMVP